MLDHFFFSLGATLPVFAVMALGWFLRRRAFLTHEFCRVSNRLVFVLALPAMLFRQIAAMRPAQLLDGRFLLFAALSTLIVPFLIWIPAHFLLPDKGEVGAFVQGAFRGNTALLGTVLLQSICGSEAYAPLIILAGVPIYNFLSVIVLSLEAGGGGHLDRNTLRSAGINILKNPIIIGIVLGLPFALLSLPVPAAADKALSMLGGMASPLALLVIGAEFRFDAFFEKKRTTLLATAIKLILRPALTLPPAILLGFRSDALVALLVLAGTPSAVSSYIMAENMGNDGVLANGIVASTTLFSALSITGWIFVLRVAGLI